MNTFVDTTPVEQRRATAALPPGTPLEIRFTGSGSEYFRIWIVNLMLTVVTLGLYLPFAKARRIRYFYANTLVDGHALSFHGNPWKMFRGFVLLVVLMGAYSLATRFSPAMAMLAFLVLCAVWPALWRASMQFRLGNTSWRGLRMRFTGALGGAYAAVAPLYLPLIAFVGLSQYAGHAAQKGLPPEEAARAATSAGNWILLPMAVAALATPWFLAATKRYQHNGYAIARQQARIDLPTVRLYGLALKAFLVSLVPTVLTGVLLGVAVYAASQTLGGGLGGGVAGAAVGALVAGVLGYAVWFMVMAPYFAARMQNLTWNATSSDAVHFHSRLTFRSLCGLTVKNWLLTALTLGLYRPFAAVNTARLRLEAVQPEVQGDVSAWTAEALAHAQDATGEAAGDFFGIDMGL